MTEAYLFLCGALGAAIYGLPMYINTRKKEPDAAITLGTVIFTGAVIGGIFTPALATFELWGFNLQFLAKPAPYPLAVATGIVSNKVVPVLVDKFLTRARDEGR